MKFPDGHDYLKTVRKIYICDVVALLDEKEAADQTVSEGLSGLLDLMICPPKRT